MDTTDRKRNTGLDILKMISILGVCYCHYGYLNTDSTDMSLIGILRILIRMLAVSAVPLFFMVNGALCLERNYTVRESLKKVAGLFGKMLFWIPVTAFLYPLISEGTIIPFHELLYRTYHWRGNGVQHFWFLFTLLIIYLIYPFINMIYRNKDICVKYVYYGIVFFFTFGNTLINFVIMNLQTVEEWRFYKYVNFFEGTNFLWSWDAYSLVYFVLGAEIIKRSRNEPVKKIPAVFTIVGGGIVYVLSCKNMALLVNNNIYMLADKWAYDTIIILCVAVSFFVISQGINYPRFIEKIAFEVGSNTLGILFFHRFFGEIVKKLFLYFKLNINGVCLGIISATTVFLLSFITTLSVKKIKIGRRLL